MTIKTIEVKVTFSWWYLYLYLPLLILMCKLSIIIDVYLELNDSRFNYWTKKAMKISQTRRLSK